MERDCTIINEEKENKNKAGDAESSYYYALSHDIRRKIIKNIGDFQFASFTSLKKVLNVSTGTIYHHLETLANLIEQKGDKKYYLNDLGRLAYNSLLDNVKTIESPSTVNREFQSPLLKAFMFLTPKRLIAFEEKDKPWIIIISFATIFIGALCCGLNGLTTVLLFFVDSSESSDESVQILFSLAFVANFLIYYLIVECCCRLFYKKKENSLKFFLTFGLNLIPIVIYLAIHTAFVVTGAIKISIFDGIDSIMLILFQVWSLWLLTFNLNANKKLKMEKGLIISLLLHYGSFTIILLLLL